MCTWKLRLEVRKKSIIFWRCLNQNSGVLAVLQQLKNSGAATRSVTERASENQRLGRLNNITFVAELSRVRN